MMANKKIVRIVNKQMNPDKTHSLSVTWVGFNKDELEDKFVDLMEFEGDWPTDETEITELGRG
jgi:hypothetical protein